MTLRELTTGLVACSLSISAASVSAANEGFQDFFFGACDNPSGQLATRCGETDNGEGNLSGDSESSLNPSQSLSINDSSLQAAQRRGQEIRERLRGKETAGSQVELGRASLLVNLRNTETESKREVDLDPSRSYDLDQQAAEFGIDYRINDALTVGGWLFWEDSELDFVADLQGRNFTPAAGRAGTLDTETWGATLFLSSSLGEHMFLDASLSYGVSDIDASRNSVFQESNRNIPQTNVFTAASSDGDELLLTSTVGYQQALGAWTLTPFVGLTYIESNTDSYQESDLSNSGLAMAFDKAEQNLTLGQVGVYLNRAILLDSFVLVPQLRLEYVAELDADDPSSRSSFLNDSSGSQYRIDSDPAENDRFDIAFSLIGVFPGGFFPYIEYQITRGDSDLERERVAAGIRYNF